MGESFNDPHVVFMKTVSACFNVRGPLGMTIACHGDHVTTDGIVFEILFVHGVKHLRGNKHRHGGELFLILKDVFCQFISQETSHHFFEFGDIFDTVSPLPLSVIPFTLGNIFKTGESFPVGFWVVALIFVGVGLVRLKSRLVFIIVRHDASPQESQIQSLFIPQCIMDLNSGHPLREWGFMLDTGAFSDSNRGMVEEGKNCVLDWALDWRVELRNSLRSASDLLGAGLIEASALASHERVLDKYQFLLPRYYASLIDTEDTLCPIRAQAIPSVAELERSEWLYGDPLKDLKHQPVSRVTHRYSKRVLVHLTPNCSMFCRYCFRKTLLNDLKRDFFDGSLDEAFSYIKEHSEINEVIFSGGDPFMVSDMELKRVLERTLEVKSIQRIRFHTRVPVTFPVRITQKLVKVLSGVNRRVVIVVHFNHPKEVTLQSMNAVELLKDSGATLFNQSVLLRGVNDCGRTLVELNEALFDLGVIPYYLHHPDRAQGTGHFDLSIKEGIEIYNELRAELPGYLVPKMKARAPYSMPWTMPQTPTPKRAANKYLSPANNNPLAQKLTP